MVVKILEKKIEGQVQFWSLLGPFLILVASAILLFKFSEHWYLPLGVLVGLPLCVKWHTKGLVAALVTLISLFLLNYTQIDLEERYWHLGMGIAMALSFIILTLSLEEVQILVNKIQVESQSRLDNFLRLDENIKESEQLWSAEKEKLSSQVEELSKELAQKKEDSHTYQKLVYLAKDELIALRNQYELVVEDSIYKKQHIAQLQERIDENEMTIQNFVNTDSERRIKNLTAELNETKTLINELKEEIEQKKYAIEELSTVKISLENDFVDSLNRERQQKAQIEHYNQELKTYHDRLLGLELKHQTLNDEKLALEETIRALHSEKDVLKSIEIRQKHELNHSNTQLEQALDLIETKEKELSIAHAKNESLIKQNELSFNEKESIIKELQNEKFVLENACRDAHLSLVKKIEECNRVQDEVSTLTNDLKHCKDELNRLESDKQTKTSEVDHLKNHCKQLEKDIELKIIEQEQLKNELTNAENVHAKNTKRVEAMYNQLKEQFEEKNTVLNQTRQELFVTQENLLALEKDFDETLLFNLTENELLLQKDFIRLGREMEKISQEHEREFDQLYTLIENLLKR